MDAKDLMIGDWLRIKEPDRYAGAFCTIRTLLHHNSDDGVYFKVFVEGHGFGLLLRDVYNDDLEPILLTDKILKKNGFEYFHKNYASLSYEHPFKLEMKQWPDENGAGGLWVICGIIEIRFVHELQHALRLCGIEKEIVL